MHYFKPDAILNSSQFGFRAICSTQPAFPTVVRNICFNFASCNYFLEVFVDLVNVVDSIARGRLFKKIEHCGIPGVALEMFKSYVFQYAAICE